MAQLSQVLAVLRSLGFGSQHPYGGTQLFIGSVPGDLLPSLVSHRYKTRGVEGAGRTWHTLTYRPKKLVFGKEKRFHPPDLIKINKRNV